MILVMSIDSNERYPGSGQVNQMQLFRQRVAEVDRLPVVAEDSLGQVDAPPVSKERRPRRQPCALRFRSRI